MKKIKLLGALAACALAWPALSLAEPPAQGRQAATKQLTAKESGKPEKCATKAPRKTERKKTNAPVM